MSEPRPIPRSLASFSQSKKLSEKPKPKPKPESEWSKHLTLPKPEKKEFSESLHPNLRMLQHGLLRKKSTKTHKNFPHSSRNSSSPNSNDL